MHANVALDGDNPHRPLAVISRGSVQRKDIERWVDVLATSNLRSEGDRSVSDSNHELGVCTRDRHIKVVGRGVCGRPHKLNAGSQDGTMQRVIRLQL